MGCSIMRLWVLSDLHDDRGLLDIERRAPFNFFVCVGGCFAGNIEGSIKRTAELPRGESSGPRHVTGFES